MTDEGVCYSIYGKTFGANQKETTLLCLALCAITKKPLRLYQILDNDSTALSQNDIKAIKDFAFLHNKNFCVIQDTLESEANKDNIIKGGIRSPRFSYNLFQKYGSKHCLLCDCKIGALVQAAHIYPIADIKMRDDLTLLQKVELATDGDNGLWLCNNHHKLFDENYIDFDKGKVSISSNIETQDIDFIDKITTIKEIAPMFITKKMLEFFQKRKTSTNN